VNQGAFPGLVARHLRFQRDLLALWLHTLRWPAMAEAAQGDRESRAAWVRPGQVAVRWTRWLEQRQRLLDRLAGHQGPHLVAETTAWRPAAEPGRADGDGSLMKTCLHELCRKELAMLEALAACEHRVRRQLECELLGVTRSLVSAHTASEARGRYLVRSSIIEHLDRRG